MSDTLKNWGTPMPIPIQKGRLGRGLASLIGETPQSDPRLPAHGEQRLAEIRELARVYYDDPQMPIYATQRIKVMTVAARLGDLRSWFSFASAVRARSRPRSSSTIATSGRLPVDGAGTA